MPWDRIELPADFDPPRIGPKRIPPGPKQPGQVNRITRDLKRGIVDAAAAYGSDGNGAGGLTGYLFHLADKHPKAFASLLGKLLPLQVNSQISSVVGQVNIVSVPAETFLTQEDVRRMSAAPSIDHEPATAADPGPMETSASEPDSDQ
jgi:hypothetical protein